MFQSCWGVHFPRLMHYDSYLLWLAYFSSVRVEYRAAGVWWKRKTQTWNSLKEDIKQLHELQHLQLMKNHLSHITLVKWSPPLCFLYKMLCLYNTAFLNVSLTVSVASGQGMCTVELLMLGLSYRHAGWCLYSNDNGTTYLWVQIPNHHLYANMLTCWCWRDIMFTTFF